MGTTSQKLTYLNDTKTQLKDMINYGLDTNEKITSETTFRNYVKSLFDAFIKTMTYPDVLYNNLPKVTGEGTSLSLNDTVYAPMRVELSPSALEQETTTGKNLLGLTDGTYSDNGITAVISNGKITLNGTATATSFIMLTLLKNIVLSNQTITISTNNSIAGGDSSTEIRVYTSSSSFLPCQFNTINNSITYTNKTDTYSRFQIRTSSGVTYNNFVLYPQLEEGSTATSYEPFTYGASPNPQYPQDIHVVSGENNVKVQNKNLLKLNEFSGTFNTTTYTTMGNYLKIKNRYNNIGRTINVDTNYFKSTRTNTYDNIQDWLFTNLLPNTTYTVSCDIATTKQAGNMTIFGKSMPYNTTQTNTTFTTDENGEFTTIVFYETQQVPGTYIELSNIQLEKNSQATSYKPHQEQNFPISLGDLEYCKIGDYEDLFFKNVVGSEYYDSTLELDKWYLKKNVGKVVLDNTLSNVGTTNFSNVYQIHANVLNISYLIGGYCDNFKYNTDSRITDNNNANYYLTDNQTAFRNGNESARDRLYIKSTNFATANELKAYFNNNPTTVYYVLATPTYTLLSDTLQTQLDNLAKAISYQDQTNVSQTNDDLPFVIKMSAIRDLSGIFELIQG